MKTLFTSLMLATLALAMHAADRANDSDLSAWVKERVKAMQPTADERRFDDIGWAPGIVPAEKLARQHTRPVFLFTFNGNIDTGRC